MVCFPSRVQAAQCIKLKEVVDEMCKHCSHWRKCHSDWQYFYWKYTVKVVLGPVCCFWGVQNWNACFPHVPSAFVANNWFRYTISLGSFEEKVLFLLHFSFIIFAEDSFKWHSKDKKLNKQWWIENYLELLLHRSAKMSNKIKWKSDIWTDNDFIRAFKIICAFYRQWYQLSL